MSLMSQLEVDLSICIGGVEVERTATITYGKLGSLAMIESFVIDNDEGYGADILEVFTQDELEVIADDLGITGTDEDDVEDGTTKER